MPRTSKFELAGDAGHSTHSVTQQLGDGPATQSQPGPVRGAERGSARKPSARYEPATPRAGGAPAAALSTGAANRRSARRAINSPRHETWRSILLQACRYEGGYGPAPDRAFDRMPLSRRTLAAETATHYITPPTGRTRR